MWNWHWVDKGDSLLIIWEIQVWQFSLDSGLTRMKPDPICHNLHELCPGILQSCTVTLSSIHTRDKNWNTSNVSLSSIQALGGRMPTHDETISRNADAKDSFQPLPQFLDSCLQFVQWCIESVREKEWVGGRKIQSCFCLLAVISTTISHSIVYRGSFLGAVCTAARSAIWIVLDHQVD